jgi:hypothetical protein
MLPDIHDSTQSVFVYTTASVTSATSILVQPPARVRTHGFTGVAAVLTVLRLSLPVTVKRCAQRAMEIQRHWRFKLYELRPGRRGASNGPRADLCTGTASGTQSTPLAWGVLLLLL